VARLTLLAAATALHAAFEPHLQEQILFPAIREHVPRAEQTVIVSELCARVAAPPHPDPLAARAGRDRDRFQEGRLSYTRRRWASESV